MTDKKRHPDYPLWHEGCDRLLEAWAELFYEKDPKDDPVSLAQFTDGCRSALFSTPQGRHFVDGWAGHFLDEAPYLGKFVPDVKYLVKDPQEPYRRAISLDVKWAERQVGTIGQVRLRLNSVTVSLFPFRTTEPQVSFTHPDRGYDLRNAAQTYFTPPGEYTLHNVMVEGRLGTVQGKYKPIWGKY